VDGGVFANNPSAAALDFATYKLGGTEPKLLSLGAGATPYRPPEELLFSDTKTLDWGYRDWIILPPHPLMKVLFDGSVVTAHSSCKWKLGDDYRRIQPMLPEDVDLADSGKVPLLIACADGYELNGTVDWLKDTWASK
jgi:hypothetical protein